MSEVERHTGEVEGLPVGWRSAPFEGTPALYLHGVPNSSLTWLPFLERTGGVALDLPGFGESVKAVVVLKAASRGKATAEDIIDWAKEHMAAYKYPRFVEFVDSLPKTGTGKVFWRKLQEEENARQPRAAG